MKRSFWATIVLFLSVAILPNTVLAWNADGHRIVAQIAYDNLTPAARQKVTQQMQQFNAIYPKNANFIDAATWPDVLKLQGVTAFNSWHWINMGYSQQGARYYRPQQQNVVWAINQAQKVLANSNATPFDQALFLAFLIHFTGDIHQPLHCISLYNRQFPQGDTGGHDYTVQAGYGDNLHSYWDQGVGYFSADGRRYPLSSDQVTQLAKQIEVKYPESYFGPQAHDLNPYDWAHESYTIAKTFVYTIPFNSTPTPQYVAQGQQIVQQRLALAGYRLANVLNQIDG